MTPSATTLERERAALAGPPLLRGRPGDAALTEQLLSPVWSPNAAWWILFTVSGLGTAMLFALILYTFVEGIGLWGNNIPVAWAFAIINFVWWIGIGHAGTFISAILLLLNQGWRTSINRITEAMTLFAVVNAGLFPVLHLGRPWFAYWLVPYPSTMQVWPQFRSSLPWDVVAVTTYFLVSLLFWYLGLIPDLASARDTAPGRLRRRVYGVFALGWRGSMRHWSQHRIAYGLLAGLATPLVLSVHSIVSMDFAIAQVPGWHSTIFPPYFVAGAIYSGFAMVLTLVVPIRWLYGLENVITEKHLDAAAKVALAMAMMLAYSYVVEIFLAWYSGDAFEEYVHLFARPFGPYARVYWLMIFCNLVVPQCFWFRRIRRSAWILFVASLFIQVGMWTERFIIVVTSLNRDFLPSSWHFYSPSWVDWGILFGTVSFFFFAFFVFLRWVPFIPLSEVKQLRFQLEHGEK